MTQPITTDERWVYGTALNVEGAPAGTFNVNTLYSELTLGEGEENWLFAAVPGPNITEGWVVTTVMLRYSFVGGVIDKIGVRDGDSEVASLENLFIAQTDGWETATFPLPTTGAFVDVSFGLGVSLHVTGIGVPPTFINDLRFAGIGLAFSSTAGGDAG